MSGILQRILAAKAEEVAERAQRTPLRELRARAADLPPPRGFAAALQAARYAGRPGVIAEIKRASPSAGVLRADFDVAAIAASYAAAGASSVSVLTDATFFQGELRDLERARTACALPALRKDFIIDAWQVFEARVAGADAVLLIVAALGDAPLLELCVLALDLEMDVLVEVHDEQELERALALPTPLIGVNNRDLKTFATSLDTTLRLQKCLPADRLLVSESGIRSRADVARLRAASIPAFLVGEAFMRAPDPGAALREMFFTEM